MRKLSQENIINCLKKNKRAMSRTEIAQEINLNPCRVSFLLSKLLRWNEVVVVEIDRKEARKRFGVKRRMMLFTLSKDYFDDGSG